MTETKLKGFIDAVNADVNQQIEDLLSSVKEKRKTILETAEDEALNAAYVKIKAAVADAAAKNKMMVSKAEQEARIKILTHRENLVRQIFSDVEKRILEFTQTDEYKNYLIDLLKGEKVDSQTTIYLKPDDMKYSELLKSYLNEECAFCEDACVKYGGLSVYDRSSSVLINKTIDNMLCEQKKNFGSKYKLS